MFCDNCGQELREGAKFCPKCGTRFEKNNEYVPKLDREVQDTYSDRFEYRDNRAMNAVPEGKSKKKHNWVLYLIAVLCAAVAVFAAVMIFLTMNSGMTPQKAYKEYYKVLESEKSKIVGFEKEKRANGVVITDINNTGIPDLLYITSDGEDGSGNLYLHTLMDNEMDIEIDSDEELSGAFGDSDTIFRINEDSAIYLRNEYGLSRITYSIDDAGTRVILTEMLAKCTFDEESGEYVYMILTDSGYLESVSEKEYNKYIEDICNQDVSIIITSLSDEELNKAFPSIDDNLSDSCDRVTDKLKNNDIAPVGSVNTEPTSKVIPETQPPTEAPKIYDVDPSDLPESLYSFIYYFDYGYHTRVGDSMENTREFDCENLDNIYDKLAGMIATRASCVNLSLYPGEKTEEIWDVNSDPLHKYGKYGCVKFDEEKILWVMHNIFNISKNTSEEMLRAVLEKDENSFLQINDGKYLYEYKENGKAYLYNIIDPSENPGFDIVYEKVRYDGERYYIIYEWGFSKVNPGYETCYIEVAEKEIEGNKYWTIYRHTKDIPELPEVNTTTDTNKMSDKDIFSMFAGSYNFTSGVGAWSTQLELKSDGSFTGQYHDTDAGAGGEGYDATLYLSKFSGKFKNPEKINSYTYSFKLDEINYENEPDTEEIGDPYDSGGKANVLIKYSTAYGISGSDTVYAYTPSAPVSKLPDRFMYWVDHLRDKSTWYGAELSYKCLYAVETEQGWLGEKE